MTVVAKGLEPIPHSFATYVNQSTEVDELTGGLVCKNCGSSVTVDYFERAITCHGCDEL